MNEEEQRSIAQDNRMKHCSVIFTTFITFMSIMFLIFEYVVATMALANYGGPCPRYARWLRVYNWGSDIVACYFMLVLICYYGPQAMRMGATLPQSNTPDQRIAHFLLHTIKQQQKLCFLFNILTSLAWMFLLSMGVWALYIIKWVDSGCSDLWQFSIMSYVIGGILFILFFVCLSASIGAIIGRLFDVRLMLQRVISALREVQRLEEEQRTGNSRIPLSETQDNITETNSVETSMIDQEQDLGDVEESSDQGDTDIEIGVAQ